MMVSLNIKHISSDSLFSSILSLSPFPFSSLRSNHFPSHSCTHHHRVHVKSANAVYPSTTGVGTGDSRMVERKTTDLSGNQICNRERAEEI